MYPIQTVPAWIATGVGNVKSTQPHGCPATIVTAFETPSRAPGLPPESTYMTARTGCEPVAAPRPDTYPVSLVTFPACGAVYLDTSFMFAVAVSVENPGVVVPKVDEPVAEETVIAIGELVLEA